MALIAVDMTPVFPDGRNGGAKIFALELLKSLREIGSGDRYLILTASWNHQELSVLDSTNTARLCVLKQQDSPSHRFGSWLNVKWLRKLKKIYVIFRERFPKELSNRLKLSTLGVDLLFCPFTAPTYAQPGIPVVSVIFDLQHLAYPYFFYPDAISTRQQFLDDVKRKADHIICISEGVRQSVLDNFDVDPQKTHVVPISVHSRFPKLELQEVEVELKVLGIGSNPYMFYPANFWPHKNHAMLLTAYGMFLSRNTNSKIELVFTGTIQDKERELRADATRMGLGDRVHFLGYLGTNQLAAVWQGCEFLIFPSLYEGFGIPLLEAMYYGKPILCSNVTSIPEIAQDAALYFDPRDPRDIVRCLETIADDPGIKEDLIYQGLSRVSAFDPVDITKKYTEIFDSAIKDPKPLENGVTGLFPDNWTGEETIITFRPGEKNRYLEMFVEAPGFMPSTTIKIELKNSDGICQKWKIHRGNKMTIRQALPEQEGTFVLLVKPTFRPSDFQINEDNRRLGLICHKICLVSPSQREEDLVGRR
jgi:glycosyltransferase involved in cell wall biosynthesis